MTRAGSCTVAVTIAARFVDPARTDNAKTDTSRVGSTRARIVISRLAPMPPNAVPVSSAARAPGMRISGAATSTAPGPLTRERARDLHLLADVESRGQATVYRFTAASVRRAFDAGWAAHEVHAFLEAVSRTPVPQPLTYLVDDAARGAGGSAGGAHFRSKCARHRRGR